MPEAPDVQVYKQYLDATALHQTIGQVEICDPQIVQEGSADKLQERLADRSFAQTCRHGKFLLVQLHNGQNVGWLVLHFGMTGELHYYKDRFSKERSEPEYTQARFDFANGYHLALVMPRKLGGLRWTENAQDFVQEEDLGPDVLQSDLDADRFQEILSDHRGMLKTALMNQSILAGLGNVYSDEILYQARLHPKTQIADLDKRELRNIYDIMQDVLHTAIDHQADPDQFPDSFLIPQRHKGGTCPACGGSVERIKVSGRSSYFCPNCQQLD